MASQPPSRASISDRRASAQQRQQKSRPTSAVEDNNRTDSRSTFHNRVKSTTTETTKRDTITREALIRRTFSPTKQQPDRANGRRSEDVERPLPKEKSVARSEQDDGPAASWSPHASLLAPSSAPLASRISVPPIAAKAPLSIQPPRLDSLSLQAQEKALIEDVLFVLMGFEGQYIRYVEAYDPLDEKSKLAGPQFWIQTGLDPSLRDLAHGMLKTATHYCAVEAFVEVQSREEMGTVNHALCAAMRKMLKDYMILIAQLEHQMLTKEDFTLHQLGLHTKATSHMMQQLYGVAHEVLKENSMLDNEDGADDSDDFENILESLKEGKDTAMPGKKVCKGGAVLRLLTRRLQSMAGDPAARQLLTLLLREASRPYMAMLNEWLHHGNVRDPHQEFLIKEQKSIRREGLEQDYTDEYWEKRYTIRQELVPPQLESLKDKVLLAGKYLNVVRECGGIENVSRDLDASTDIPHTFDDPRFVENVSGAYAFANRSLMTLLLTTHNLPARLRSLKHYFLLDRSDFFSYFLELTRLELKKPAKSINVGKLQSLLDIVIRHPGSVAAEDTFKEDVKVVMNDVGLTGWLMRVVNVQGMDADATSLSSYTPAAGGSDKNGKEISGYEGLTLDYAVPFPLSLVVSRVTLTRYQLLFRYLLSLRHLETMLTGSWTEHIKARAWNNKTKGDAAVARKIENWKRRAWCLRSRMLCFVQQLLYYCTSEVIEPNWLAFMSRLSHAGDEEEADGDSKMKRTVDELMQDHVDFLATCLKECMLTNSKLLRINSKVMSTCTMFANYTSSLSRYLASADPDLASSQGSTSNKPGYDPAKLDKLFSILHQYEDHFSRHLKILLDALNFLAATETVVFLSLCARLSMANEGGPDGGPGPDAYG
ncbi:hypothetical protein M409DRAFT_27437 [Zasmidium cellare ATCC 36951]|uniref:Spindle pole body component n=1 Tax=Zasmidium cellare ATCC 36951 TaxID=1080233 RepID=A0A6A6C731_ZASCE|nr:uncharacterized protein M409DRAFT_27437 [Zasmidium cellare ATCC 36951]KAF2162058.1 hypothetical protein M409DRAFT_27437 [Zasmidium cellare ATCC 36951]